MATQKLIIAAEVPGLGEPGDVVEVKAGYARNYLLPRGLALAWTRGGEKQVEAIRRARKSREIRDLGHAQEIRSQLNSLVVRIPTKAGAAGRLFGSVTAADIAEALAKAGGPQLDRRALTLEHPIKVAGRHDVPVRLHPEVAGTIKIDVVPVS